MTVLQPKRMTDQVVHVIRERIVTGELAAGARIEIKQLAGELGVSQTPVREAILHLETLGLVTRQPYRGTVVAGIDVTQLEEITALRIDLEGRAALLGVPRLSSADLERMREVHDELAAHEGDEQYAFEHFNRLNREFHGIIYAAADSPTLTRLIGTLQDGADRIRLHVDMTESRAAEFHAQILDACVRRDSLAACRATRQHLLHNYVEMRGEDHPATDGLLADVLSEFRLETAQ